MWPRTTFLALRLMCSVCILNDEILQLMFGIFGTKVSEMSLIVSVQLVTLTPFVRIFTMFDYTTLILTQSDCEKSLSIFCVFNGHADAITTITTTTNDCSQIKIGVRIVEKLDVIFSAPIYILWAKISYYSESSVKCSTYAHALDFERWANATVKVFHKPNTAHTKNGTHTRNTVAKCDFVSQRKTNSANTRIHRFFYWPQ